QPVLPGPAGQRDPAGKHRIADTAGAGGLIAAAGAQLIAVRAAIESVVGDARRPAATSTSACGSLRPIFGVRRLPVAHQRAGSWAFPPATHPRPSFLRSAANGSEHASGSLHARELAACYGNFMAVPRFEFPSR